MDGHTTTHKNVEKINCMPDGNGQLACKINKQKGIGTRYDNIDQVKTETGKNIDLTRTNQDINFSEPVNCTVNIKQEETSTITCKND